MNVLQATYLNELDDLLKLINYYEIESQLLGLSSILNPTNEEQLLLELSDALKAFPTSKRKFNYNSIIISLYGIFEKFIESALTTYIDELNGIYSSYKDLPKNIRKNHYFLSLSLLNKVEQPKYDGPLTKENIINNLNACINLNSPYQINGEAFAQHTANFRVQSIDDSFKYVGIDNINKKILQNSSFNAYIYTKLALAGTTKIPIDKAFEEINDLAERRNDVAHGVSHTILNNTILLDYVDFFKKYIIGLTEILSKEMVIHELNGNSTLLGKITDIYQGGNVVCLFTNRIKLKKGDYIIGRNGKEIIKSKIIEIQLDGVNVDDIDDGKDYEVGLLIDDHFKKNFAVYHCNK